jgi:hypothetical protein
MVFSARQMAKLILRVECFNDGEVACDKAGVHDNEAGEADGERNADSEREGDSLMHNRCAVRQARVRRTRADEGPIDAQARKGNAASEEGVEEEKEEPFVIAGTNARREPEAVVVHAEDAPVAHTAVVRTRRLERFALVTPANATPVSQRLAVGWGPGGGHVPRAFGNAAGVREKRKEGEEAESPKGEGKEHSWRGEAGVGGVGCPGGADPEGKCTGKKEEVHKHQQQKLEWLCHRARERAWLRHRKSAARARGAADGAADLLKAPRVPNGWALLPTSSRRRRNSWSDGSSCSVRASRRKKQSSGKYALKFATAAETAAHSALPPLQAATLMKRAGAPALRNFVVDLSASQPRASASTLLRRLRASSASAPSKGR